MSVSQYAMKNTHNNYLVLGAGITGWSVVAYLLAQGHSVRVTDSREIPPNADKIKAVLASEDICFGQLQWQWLHQADTVIVSPGIDSQRAEIQAAIAAGVEVMGDIELFARTAQKPYIAITGSNGKSTVTTLVTELLASQNIAVRAGANIGEPALNLLADDDLEMYVLELSSFQLETCQSLRPCAAAVLNITDDHLDRHEQFARYQQIKLSIYKQAARKVVPRQAIFNTISADCSFGADVPASGHYGVSSDASGQQWLVHGDHQIMRVNDIPLLGLSGQLNVLAALALIAPYITDMAAAVSTIKAFSGLAHRCEVVSNTSNILWINDSKATNIGATIAALKGIDRTIILLLGGVHKGGSIADIVPIIKEKVRAVIVLGEAADMFAHALQHHIMVKQAASLTEGVSLAKQLALAGDAVLLSPACASFDMFANYMQRGEAFRSAVHALHGAQT